MTRFVLTLPVLLASCLPDETVSGYVAQGAEYWLEDWTGGVVEASLRFPAKGRIAGAGPCGGYAGRQTAPYPWFEVLDLDGTAEDCPEAETQARFLQGLQAMTLAEALGNVLILSNDAGDEMVFRTAQPIRE